jgi:hypothetical protein
MFNILRINALALLALIFMVAMPNNVLAVSLGEIQVFRTEANMFHGEIPITLVGEEQIKKIMVSTGNRTNYAKELGAEFDATIVSDGDQKFLVITGKTPQEIPFFTLLVSIDMGSSTLSRNFPVQFDGQITPLPPRKLSVSTVAGVKITAKNIDLAAKPTTDDSSWEGYLLWWVGGGVLGFVLFWIWWRQGTLSDEDLLILAREEKAKLPVESWETLLAANEGAEPGAVPEMEQAPATEKSQIVAKTEKNEPDTKVVVKEDQAANSHKSAPQPVKQPVEVEPEAPQQKTEIVLKALLKATETGSAATKAKPAVPVVAEEKAVKLPKPKPVPPKPTTPPKVVNIPKSAPEKPVQTSIPKPAPKTSKPASSGRLSPVIMKGGSDKPTAEIKKDVISDVMVADDNSDDLSMGATMSSLEQILDDNSKK